MLIKSSNSLLYDSQLTENSFLRSLLRLNSDSEKESPNVLFVFNSSSTAKSSATASDRRPMAVNSLARFASRVGEEAVPLLVFSIIFYFVPPQCLQPAVIFICKNRYARSHMHLIFGGSLASLGFLLIFPMFGSQGADVRRLLYHLHLVVLLARLKMPTRQKRQKRHRLGRSLSTTEELTPKVLHFHLVSPSLGVHLGVALFA